MASDNIRQVYARIQEEMDTLQRNVLSAEDNIQNYKTTTINMEWRGDAAEAVGPTLNKICTDIEKLRVTIDNFKREAGASAERTQAQSHENAEAVQSIVD